MLNFIDQWIYIGTFCFLLVISLGFVAAFKYKAVLFIKAKERIIKRSFLLIFILLESIVLIISIIEKIYINFLFGDLCSMLSFLLIFALLINNEKIYKALASWCVLGAVITISGGSPDFEMNGVLLGLAYYTKHIFLLIIGAFFLVNDKPYSRKEFAYPIIFIGFFMLYVFLTSGIPYLVTGKPLFGIYSTFLFKPSYSDNVHVPWSHAPIRGDYNFFYNLPGPIFVWKVIFYVSAISCALILTSTTKIPHIYKKVNKNLSKKQTSLNNI